jgi:prevent-host-death family protein
VRDLKNNLSRYLDRVADGDEVIVTLHGRPVARLSQIDRDTDRLAELVAAGLARPPVTAERRLPAPVKAAGTVSDLVADQRR